MSMKKYLMCALLALGAAAAVPVMAAVGVNIEIGVPPPPPYVEVVPGPRSGYAWAPGYWAWHGNRHIWIRGRWILARPGYAWAPEHWEQRGPRWVFVGGGWARERGPVHGRGREEFREREHDRR